MRVRALGAVAAAAVVALTACGGAEAGTRSPQAARQDAPVAETQPTTASPDGPASDGGSGPSAQPTGATTTGAAPTTGGTPSASASTTADSAPSVASSTAAPGTDGPAAVDDMGFLMPSENVACLMREHWVACQILEKDYRPSTEEVVGADCDVEDADTLILETEGVAEWHCSHTPVADQALVGTFGSWATGRPGYQTTVGGQRYAVLPYGETVVVGGFWCDSRESGVRCQNAEGWGFRLARGSYDLV